jgi:hypothetical protein
MQNVADSTCILLSSLLGRGQHAHHVCIPYYGSFMLSSGSLGFHKAAACRQGNEWAMIISMRFVSSIGFQRGLRREVGSVDV